MEHDKDKIDEAVLALLYLTTFSENAGQRAWKGHDWGALDRLYEKGYIGDPKSKAKSVIVTDEGAAESERLFKLLFGKSE